MNLCITSTGVLQIIVVIAMTKLLFHRNENWHQHHTHCMSTAVKHNRHLACVEGHLGTET